MKEFLLTGAAFAALVAGPAMAADLRVQTPAYKAPLAAAAGYNWTGFYVGGNLGYAWGHSDASSTFSCPVPGCPYVNPVNHSAFGAAGTGSYRADGFTGGLQMGYNLQNGAAIVGWELDFNAFSLSGSRSAGGLVPVGGGQSFTTTTTTDTDWLFTARGRLGWAVAPSYLVYVTGGVAVTELKVSNAFADTLVPPISGTSSSRSTKAGWVVGGGLEWAASGNWTIKAEYLYVNFGSVSTNASVFESGNTIPNQLTTSADLRANIVRAGFNYRFF
jgi:outer membrane immunogenic protein